MYLIAIDLLWISFVQVNVSLWKYFFIFQVKYYDPNPLLWIHNNEWSLKSFILLKKDRFGFNHTLVLWQISRSSFFNDKLLIFIIPDNLELLQDNFWWGEMVLSKVELGVLRLSLLFCLGQHWILQAI